MAETQFSEAVVTNSINSSISSNENNVSGACGNVSDLPGLTDLLNLFRNITMDESFPNSSTIHFSGLSNVQSVEFTSIDGNYLAIEPTSVNLFEANSGCMGINTQFTMAVFTNGEDLIWTSKSSNKNG